MNALKETENMNRQLFIEWHPADHVQPSPDRPAGTVMFAPPFRDPANYNFIRSSSPGSTWSARRCTTGS
jgi:hypothetical protein